jgi:NRPS condensation-like uncharacterized protein
MKRDQSKDFDVVGLWEAMEAQRKRRDLSWQEVMDEISAASSILVASLGSKNHPMSASTVKNMAKRGTLHANMHSACCDGLGSLQSVSCHMKLIYRRHHCRKPALIEDFAGTFGRWPICWTQSDAAED